MVVTSVDVSAEAEGGRRRAEAKVLRMGVVEAGAEEEAHVISQSAGLTNYQPPIQPADLSIDTSEVGRCINDTTTSRFVYYSYSRYHHRQWGLSLDF